MSGAKLICAVAAAAGLAMTLPAAAQNGPVADACAEEIGKLCADKQHGTGHGTGEVRDCLEANKDKVSEACKQALDTTGPGHGMGMGKGMDPPH